jgi:two-component system OmpR family sensor kinase
VGRLFWKFFILFWLAQLASGGGIGLFIWLKSQSTDHPALAVDASPPATFVVAAAAATLRHGGVAALRALMEERANEPGPPLVAVDDAQQSLFGPTATPEVIARVRQLAASPEAPTSIAQVTDSSGRSYLLFVPPRDASPAHAPPRAHFQPQDGGPHHEAQAVGPRPRRAPWSPLIPIITGGLVSLFFAAGLAWYFSKPIRHLRAAFERAADGCLEPRLACEMGRRRDELADLGRDFDRMVLRLKALIDSQRSLLHDVSHELRSPLARLQAAIGLLHQQPDRLDDSLARIERESERMDTLVSELLTLSRLEAGMAGPLDETVDLSEVLRHVLDDARFEASARHCQVQLFASEEFFVLGDAELLHRAIENIVRNALKHSPEGADVDIYADTGTEGGHVQLQVSDRGPGVPEADLSLIFKPFFRSSAVKSPDGHGLGLALSSRVIENLQGRIQASNRDGGGLCVSIILPTVKPLLGSETP